MAGEVVIERILEFRTELEQRLRGTRERRLGYAAQFLERAIEVLDRAHAAAAEGDRELALRALEGVPPQLRDRHWFELCAPHVYGQAAE